MQGGWAAQRRPGGTGCLKWGVPPNNAMQLTRGVWMRMEASLSARVIVIQGKVVRPSQLIASVVRTIRGGGERMSRSRRALVVAFVCSAVVHAGEFGRCEQVAGTSGTPKEAETCQDSQGGSYSLGAVVQIGGKKMKCVVGPHWVPGGSTSADSTADVLDVGDTNLAADFEGATLAAFRNGPLPALECDALLNAAQAPQELTRVPVGEKRVLMFWTPTCSPCKPLLADLAALADRGVSGLSVVGVVQSVDSELEAPGEWALLRVKQLMTTYKVGFPTCVHSSRDQMKRWHAEGVPLTLLLSNTGVERVAAGGRNGQRLVAELAATLAK
jgi:thiol-disulfide isomerase/thioredoxin